MPAIAAPTPLQAADSGRESTEAERLVIRWIMTKRSPHTRFNYGLDLGCRSEAFPRPGTKGTGKPRASRSVPWLAFCDTFRLDPLSAREEHIALWARGMESAGLSAPTVARKMAAVSSWYGWLKRSKHVAENPAADLARPYVDADTSKTPGLTRDQALALLAAADGSKGPQSLRTAALTAILLFTGARVSEACDATVGDLGMDRGHRVLWVTRKGGGRQALVLPAPALERVDAYLAARNDLERLPALRGTAGKSRPLLATYLGAAIGPADVWKLLRRLGRAAGLPGELVSHMGPHSMRHSFATLYLDAGGNLRDLQDAMGHKDPRTTRRYDRARNSLDRSPGYTLAAYLADGGNA